MDTPRQKMKEIGRLKKRADFLRAQSAGRKWVAPTMVLQVAENGLAEARFGVTATRRTEKSAVKRNRIKRRLRAAAYDVIAEGAKPGMDYVLIGRRETVTRPYEDLKKDLRWCLKRLECLKS